MNTHDVVNWLGGRRRIQRAVRSDLEWSRVVGEGLPTGVVDEILERGKLVPKELYRLVIPRRTLTHRKHKGERLSRDESDRMARVARVIAFAEETFGTEEKAWLWMRRSNRALAGRIPLDLLETGEGARVVETVLGRIAHGVFS